MKKISLALMGCLFVVFNSANAELIESDASALPAAERTQSSNASSDVSVNEAVTSEEVPATSTETQSANVDPAMEQTGFSSGSVVRSSFTSAINEREPVDSFNETPNDSKVYFFTELRDMSGQTAVHRWEHNGEVKAEVEFKVGGPRWRVWSSKSFNPQLTGEWKVSVLNGANEVIKEKTLQLTTSSITNESASDTLITNETGDQTGSETPAATIESTQ